MYPEPLSSYGADLVTEARCMEEKCGSRGDVGGQAQSTLLVAYVAGDI